MGVDSINSKRMTPEPSKTISSENADLRLELNSARDISRMALTPKIISQEQAIDQNERLQSQ